MSDPAQGGMNNYKGVMLCSRPNEPTKAPVEKPFCARVEANIQLGLNPTKKGEDMFINRQPRKKINVALQRHKDWLNIYKLKMNLKKEEEEEQQLRQEEKFEKVKEIAAKDRVRAKKYREEFDKVNNSIVRILLDDDNAEANKDTTQNVVKDQKKKLESETQNKTDQENFEKENQSELQQSINKKESKKKDGQKPKWAQTEKEVEQEEEMECDDLLAFASGLDYDQYINDLEVQSMVKAIKSRVQDISEKAQKAEAKERKLERAKQRANENDDTRSDVGSAVSAADSVGSVLSERSQQSIESLKEKLNEQKKGKADWETSSKNGQESKATIEERIAKHVADEVLRNYKHLGAVHSNQSIRKILEREAQNAVSKGLIEAPVISVIKENTLRKNELDPNNLPYLHRNPAI